MIVVAAKPKIHALKSVQDEFERLEEKFRERFEWKCEPLSAAEIAEIYKRSSIYIQPSFYEAFGLCILEAMASGNAVIASNIGGIPEVVGDAGVLVNLGEKEFTNSIQKFLDDRKGLEKYRILAAKRAEQFDWNIIAKKTLDLYKKIEKSGKR